MIPWHGIRMGIASAAMLVIAGSARGISPADECAAAKNKIAGIYALCRQRAEAKAIKTGDRPDYARCDARYIRRWANAELNGGGMCLTTGDQAVMQTFITRHTDVVAVALVGIGLPRCGDNAINVAGEQCDGPDLGGETCRTFGFPGGSLSCAACQFDTSACEPCAEAPICGDNVINVAGEQCDGTNLGGETCTTLGFADGSLTCSACLFDTNGCECPVPGVPASGQTTAYGTGSDGDVEAGAALSYTDNGDGTITDNNTGLMWEKKDDSGGIHDLDNSYSWCSPMFPGLEPCDDAANPMDGSVTHFLSTLNGGGGFAGHRDWRIPNYKELTSILNLENSSPVVADTFYRSATCRGCTDVTASTCSCTSNALYWSSTTFPTDSIAALVVSFDDGQVWPYGKSSYGRVRAVRGGL